MAGLYSKERKIYWLIFIMLWGYVWLRAVFTQMTHDETANFFRFVHTGNFLPYALDTSATNHLLNSAFAWIFYAVFGAEAWALRLGNVLAFPVYFYFLVKLGTCIKQPFLRIFFVVVLAFTHNLIEFFAMSRGYGHSMAFLLGALWFLLRSFKKPTPANYFFTLVFANLGLAANLTLLNSVILIIGFLMLRLIIQTPPKILQKWRYVTIILFFGLGPLIFFSVYLFHLKSLGDLYYGEASGLWNLTVRSLIKTMLDPGGKFIEVFVAIYLLMMLAAGMFFIFRKFQLKRIFNPHLIFFFFLVGNVLAVWLLHMLLDVNFPEDRTGLYFVVYFLGSIFFLIDFAISHFKIDNLKFIVLPLIFIPLHFFINFNLTHNSFESQTIPRGFYEKVMEDFTPGDTPPTIGGYMGRELRWAFLNFKNGGLLGKVQGDYYPDTLEDFQIADSLYLNNWREYYDSIDYYPTSDFYLLKRKKSVTKTPVFHKSGITTKGETNVDYFRFFIIDVDSLAGKYVQINFELKFNTKAKPFLSWLIANSLNKENQQTGYEYFPLEWLKTNWEGEQGHVINNMILKLPDDIQKLNFYIWNKELVSYAIEDGSVEVLVYE